VTFQQVVQVYFGSTRPVSDDEVAALKLSMSGDEWKGFVSQVRAAMKTTAA